MKDLAEPDAHNARLIVEKLHFDWGHYAASQIIRILADAGGVDANVSKVADSVASDCDVCAAFERVPGVGLQ